MRASRLLTTLSFLIVLLLMPRSVLAECQWVNWCERDYGYMDCDNGYMCPDQIACWFIDSDCVSGGDCWAEECTVDACDPGLDPACACEVWGGQYCDPCFWDPQSCDPCFYDPGLCDPCYFDPDCGLGGDGGDPGGGGGGGGNIGPPYAGSNLLGKDANLDGIADCEWTAVESTHWRAPNHTACQLFGSGAECDRPSPHRGLDFSANDGDRVNSIMFGYVNQLGYDDSNGNFIRVIDPQGRESTYIHLSELPTLALYTWVYPGTELGSAGHTGAAQGAHLHLQVKTPEEGVIDPLRIMASGC